MTATEKSSQVFITEALAAAAHDVADSTADIPKPSDSYAILASLAGTQESLTRAYEQLAAWHGQVVEGVHHAGEAEGGDPDNPGWVNAERSLRRAADRSAAAAEALRTAHTANGVARWFDEIRADES
ncbi:MAG TPA: hypothetical protein DCP11_02255 [Microbacteriaceae bacterium]|nr:hypothetical protein [Microbacteriaceae bacterium]